MSRTRVVVLFGGRSVEREVSRHLGAHDRRRARPGAVRGHSDRRRPGRAGSFAAAESARLLASGPGAREVPRSERARPRAARRARAGGDRTGAGRRRLPDHPRHDGGGRRPAGISRDARSSLRRRGRDRLGDRDGQGGLQGAASRRRHPDREVRRGLFARRRGRPCARRLPRARLRPSALRQAVVRRLLRRRHEGQELGRPRARRRARAVVTTSGRSSRRGSTRGSSSARSSATRSRRRRSSARSCRAASSTTTRTSTSRTARSCSIPAPLPEAVAAEVRRLAVEAFRVCGTSRGWRAWTSSSSAARTASWSTSSTRCPASPRSRCTRRLWEASGLPLPKLLDELIRLALERARAPAPPLARAAEGARVEAASDHGSHFPQIRSHQFFESGGGSSFIFDRTMPRSQPVRCRQVLRFLLVAPRDVRAVALAGLARQIAGERVPQDVAALEVLAVGRLLEDEVLGEVRLVVADVEARHEDVRSAAARPPPEDRRARRRRAPRSSSRASGSAAQGSHQPMSQAYSRKTLSMRSRRTCSEKSAL